MAPFDEAIDPVYQVRAIENELRVYDPGMLEKPRWLVLNKGDLLSEAERQDRAAQIVKALQWEGPWFVTSALSREGTWPIMLRIQQFFDDQKRDALEAPKTSPRARGHVRLMQAPRCWHRVQPQAAMKSRQGRLSNAPQTPGSGGLSALMRALMRLLWRRLCSWIRPREENRRGSARQSCSGSAAAVAWLQGT